MEIKETYITVITTYILTKSNICSEISVPYRMYKINKNLINVHRYDFVSIIIYYC